MKDEQVVGYSREMADMLETLRNRIGIMLENRPSQYMEGVGTSTIDPRFDIIIGNVGIKDLSKSSQPLKALPSSLPGADQWPNVSGYKRLNPEWITADHEYPGGTKTAWKLFIESQTPEQIEEKDEEDHLGFREMFTEEQMKAAFNAGYEAARKAK